MASSPTSLTSLDEITESVVTKLGHPEPPLEAEELVRGLVLELADHDLLLIEDDGDDPTARFAESDDALRDALRHVVSEDMQGWVPPAQVTGADLLAAAQRHRVTSVLATKRSHLALPSASEEKLETTYRQESAAIRLLEKELIEAVDTLPRAGIRVLALEGLALAVQAHGHVTARGTDDHDLLVAPGDLEGALEVLTALGWQPGLGFPAPDRTGQWNSFVRDYSEMPLTRRGSVIDLRWRIARRGRASVGFDELWERRSSVMVGLVEVPTLSSYDALVHALDRATSNHPSRMRDLLDVWLLAARASTWQEADPLLSTAHLSVVGEAVRAFGMPKDASAAVHEAARLAGIQVTTGE
ncbi:hypothetical protein EXE58_10605 [Nocardioides seonyuensis]|uniref:Nucleotidyltransferase family protein n=1 Tax=Nocardioides seonyuensis TaxID=2518371 RepID=A0A4P7IF32_9ACTN|nr:nucleotidyltransferase family protein [Nocardioides seonyuensis]QBX55865.1 hypothetical protein EXE58_10605 [Nocardioides seonyuensis]